MKLLMNKKIFCLYMTVVLLFASTSLAYAENNSDNLADALNYLQTYSKTLTNEFGQTCTVSYDFSDEQDLYCAAEYIAVNGIDAFEEVIENYLSQYRAEEQTIASQRSTSPSVSYAHIAGAGVHHVSSEASGFYSFPNVGTVEYLASLQYDVTLSSGQITRINNCNFDISYMSSGGSWGNVTINSDYSSSRATVTASYTISKTLEIPVLVFSVPVRTQSTIDYYTLITTLGRSV